MIGRCGITKVHIAQKCPQCATCFACCAHLLPLWLGTSNVDNFLLRTQTSVHGYVYSAFIPPPPQRVALEGKGSQSRSQRRFDGRLEEVAKAVGCGYCRLQMPLKPAFGVRETVAGRRLDALEGGGGTSPPSNASSPPPPCLMVLMPMCTFGASPSGRDEQPHAEADDGFEGQVYTQTDQSG